MEKPKTIQPVLSSLGGAGQAVLIVLDGWGYREDKKDNAVASAKTPNFDKYWRKFPHTLLEASGLAVGLPAGQMGNSEIGHTTIGAGTVIDTDLVRIKKAIEANEFLSNPAFQKLWNHVKEHNSTLHMQGLLGHGGVHSHSEHLFAFLKATKEVGIKDVAIHVFTDGRDTPPQSAAGYLKELEDFLAELEIGFIATVSGRFFAMDRDNNWDRLSKVEQALFERKGHVCAMKPSEFVASLYNPPVGGGKLDEHLEPIVCTLPEGTNGVISKNDGVFFFNFRADRARMITKKLLDRVESDNLCFVTLTDYGKEYKTNVAFPPRVIQSTLAKELSSAGKTQAHIAETEKFPHATYFLNGGVEKPHEGEKHIMLDSRKDVPTHDLAPKMRAQAIADKAIEEINAGTHFLFINFANPDMVGHTANVPAIIEAIEETDTQCGRVVDALLARGGVAFITADHGNAELNVDQTTGEKHTAHTTNLVPAIVTQKNTTLRNGGGLADIAPTILSLLGVKKPEVMTGKNLINF